MTRWLQMLAFCGLAAAACGQSTDIPLITHAELQAVGTDGRSTYDAAKHPFRIHGILISDPEEMLDPTYDPDATANVTKGGEFQVFFQGMENDTGGTALYMMQNYETRGMNGHDYGAVWPAEVQRVTTDATTGRTFRKGDLVEVTARTSLYFNGKRNITEAHNTNEMFNFDVALLQANVGLPKATVVQVEDLVDENGEQIFDVTRQTGGERWQGMRVRMDGLYLATTNGWCATNAWGDRLCTVSNQTGRLFTIRHPRQDLGPPPTGGFSAIGILNQEGGHTNGYELFIQETGPVISMQKAETGSMELSFQGDFEGYIVQYTDDLVNGNWKPLDATPKFKIVVEDAEGEPLRYYRLEKKTD